jgi:hypothetical protein
MATIETRYQRIAREQAERQAARNSKLQAEFKANQKKIRAAKTAQRERRYLDVITSDHDHSMDY